MPRQRRRRPWSPLRSGAEFGDRATVTVSRVPFGTAPPPAPISRRELAAWGTAAFFALASLAIFLSLRKARAPEPSAPGDFPPADSLAAPDPLAATRGRFLELALRHAEAFRSYYGQLDEGARAATLAGMDGPAFRALLGGLGLPLPAGPRPPADAEGLLAAERSFEDFVRAFQWQAGRPFGFLRHADGEALGALAASLDAFDLAFLLRVVGPAEAAAVLEGLSLERRVQVLSLFRHSRGLEAGEVEELERRIRARWETQRQRGSFSVADETYWSELLASARRPELFLPELEASFPNLRGAFARYRFTAEDFPRLPLSDRERMLDALTNEQVATLLALLAPEGRGAVAEALPPGRRGAGGKPGLALRGRGGG